MKPRYKGVLIDLGGVVYEGDTLIAGAGEALAMLREAGIAVRFLTNTTSRPLDAILDKLDRLGLEVGASEVFTPVLAARNYLRQHGLTPHLLVHPSLTPEFADLPAGARPAVVIADARDGFTYANLNAALRQLLDGAVLIALARNRVFRDDDGGLSLDVGAFVAALEYASGQEAVVLGKPAPAFFHLAVDDMGLAPDDVAMIGDDAEFDVAAAITAGLDGYLVRTGKWHPGATDGIDPLPTGECDDLRAVATAICGGQ